MKKKFTYILYLYLVILLYFDYLICREQKSRFEIIRDKIAQSFLVRNPESIFYSDNPKSDRWDYEQALMLEAIKQLWLETGNRKYFDYIQKNIDLFVQENGSIKTYKYDDFNIDNIAGGKSLLFLFKTTGLDKYKIAADTLRKQLQNQPRTKEGGFWHKKIYPYQMWLDGLYMVEPFYAMYSALFKDTSAFDDITNQFLYIYKHTYDAKTGLLYHGWDESRVQRWANQQTGNSPNFWNRALGWYAMALVDVLDFLPNEHINRNEILRILKNLCNSLLKFRDKKTGLWYQVIDQGGRRGNYLEASGSCMFIYTFAKGVNKGYLDIKFGNIAKMSYNGVMKYLTSEDSLGNINLLQTCQGAGLGGNPYRDGSFEYYINEPQRINDFKGYGPFILAANELVKLEKNNIEIGKGKIIGLDYYYNNEWKNGKQYHYIWEDTAFSGFSELGNIIKSYGAKIINVKNAPTEENLNKLNAYIIVDPDTPLETEKPNYLEEDAIQNIKKWVKEGGVLVLMGNDSGNCEFDHFNKLAEEFGIRFDEVSKNRVIGKNYEMGAICTFPTHPLFTKLNKIFMKEISTLTLKASAFPVLIHNGDIVIAESRYGKGYVLAIGDPWLYNEYIDNRKLPVEFENWSVAKNFIKWILINSQTVK